MAILGSCWHCFSKLKARTAVGVGYSSSTQAGVALIQPFGTGWVDKSYNRLP